MPSRDVHHADALRWLPAGGVLHGSSLITSLPDVSGLPGLGLPEWRRWFVEAAVAVLAHTPDEGVAIFYQTDIKRAGTWVDKAFLCQQAALQEGSALLWHKVVCRQAPGSVIHGRPGYGHLLCFSRGVRDERAHATPDVLPETGPLRWSQAMGAAVCEAACRYVLERTSTRTVVDPFCGHGGVLEAANALGMDAIGVDLSRRCVSKSRRRTT